MRLRPRIHLTLVAHLDSKRGSLREGLRSLEADVVKLQQLFPFYAPIRPFLFCPLQKFASSILQALFEEGGYESEVDEYFFQEQVSRSRASFFSSFRRCFCEPALAKLFFNFFVLNVRGLTVRHYNGHHGYMRWRKLCLASCSSSWICFGVA